MLLPVRPANRFPNAGGGGKRSRAGRRTTRRRYRPSLLGLEPLEERLNPADIFLQGNFVEVGIHDAGSFGSTTAAPAGFHSLGAGGRLGFVADQGKDGFNVGNPQQTGDYFVPGTPEEGWALEWTSSGGSEATFGNFGLMGLSGVQKTSLTNTSAGNIRSAVWVGLATKPGSPSEQLRVTQTVRFHVNDLFFTINVVLENVGTSTLNSVEYLRNVDPDQEQPLTGNFVTDNWVAFQPTAGDPRALAVAKGLTYGLTLGLGTIDARAKVSVEGFSNRDPDAILNSPVTYPEAAKHRADEAIALAYRFGTLTPGQSVDFTYAYILNAADLEVALSQLAAVTILQPTGTVSGNQVVFQATTVDVTHTTLVEFFAGGVKVGEDDTPDGSGIFAASFDSTQFGNGPLEVQAVAHFSNQPNATKATTVNVSNAGPPITFQTPLNGQIFSGANIPIAVTVDPSHPPIRVSFFREILGPDNQLISLPLDVDSTPQDGFTSSCSVADLPDGTNVTIKAVAVDALGRTTTRAVTGESNRPPELTLGDPPAFGFLNQGQPYHLDVTGNFATDPGDDPLTVTITFGDGTSQAAELGHGGSFTISHDYATEGAKQITVTAQDDDGGVTAVTFFLQILPAQPSQATSTVVQPNAAGEIQANAAVGGLEAEMTGTGVGGPATLSLALFEQNNPVQQGAPAQTPIGVQNPGGTANAATPYAFADIRITGIDPDDNATATVRWEVVLPDAVAQALVLYFWDGATWVEVAPVTKTVTPLGNGLSRVVFEITFSATSTPPIWGVPNTVFTVAVPAAPSSTPTTVTPPLALTTTSGLNPAAFSSTATFSSNTQITLVLRVSQGSQLSTSRPVTSALSGSQGIDGGETGGEASVAGTPQSPAVAGDRDWEAMRTWLEEQGWFEELLPRRQVQPQRGAQPEANPPPEQGEETIFEQPGQWAAAVEAVFAQPEPVELSGVLVPLLLAGGLERRRNRRRQHAEGR